MQTDKDISEINLAKDYTEHLWDIGKTFLQSFRKRSQTLPLHIQIVCGIDGWDIILKSKPYLANAHDDYGRVPLMVYYHTFIYEKLLKYGADPNAKVFVIPSTLQEVSAEPAVQRGRFQLR
jgi:hypothetical protein